MAPVALTRRGAVQAAAAAGLATATAGAGTAVAGGDGRRRHNWDTPVPEPIPGGVEIGPGQVIHVWAPGPPEITLPFTGFPFQGLNVEPTTIRDFKGFAAAGFHVGTATGADGTRYDFETDVRAFRGTYIDATGKRRFGTFGFIWFDLFVPGTGTPAQQVHDFNGGIMANGLFWTVPADKRDLRVSRDGRRAVLEMHDVPVLDSFQFFSPNQIPAEVSFRIEWRASGPFVRRGSGNAVPPTDPAAFLGDIAPARSTASCTGKEWGFAFRTDQATTELPGRLGGYAQMGRTRNGVFLEP